MKTIAFFSSKTGIGKTTLVYNLGWKLAEQGLRVLLLDLDPQSNLSAMCMDEERLVRLWSEDESERRSIWGALQPIMHGTGELKPAHIEPLSSRLAVVPGDLRLARYEQELAEAWPRCLDGDPGALRATSIFHRIMLAASDTHEADVILMDVGHDLGAINRAALISADVVISPVGADLFSIQGLQNVGPAIVQWRTGWRERLDKNRDNGMILPSADMHPIGYIVMQPNIYGGRTANAEVRWMAEIPSAFMRSVLQQEPADGLELDNDPCMLAVLRYYRSLMSLAQTARKPIFKLTPADGAIGAHSSAVRKVSDEFEALSSKIIERVGVRASP